MSSSVSTRTYQITEGNTVKTITEKTVTSPDGKTVTTKEEKTETRVGGGAAPASFSNNDDMTKRFNEMRLKSGGGPSKSSSGGQPTSVPASAGAGGAAPEVSLDDFRKQSLKAHNDLRKKHQVPALTMSADLNTYAQNWADHLVKTGNFQHSDCDLNGDILGENIANKWSSNGADYTGEEAVQQWYSEISKHDFNAENNSGTGHFTQVVWKGSKELGMGKAKGKDGKVIVVGSYRPAGNMLGDFKKNVLPPQ